MAKTKMQCLTSGNLCKDCALYRARHYYLCLRDANIYKPNKDSNVKIGREK